MMRPAVVRRRPLLRAAAIGGTFAAGRAMGRRAERETAAQGQQSTQPQQTQQTQQAQPQQSGGPQGQVPGQRESAEAGPSVMDQLSQLTALHDKGALSDQEFAAAKAKILGS